MDAKIKHSYEFGPFRVDAANHLLLRDGQVVPLKPKVFDTLVALVENRGRVLGKDELMEMLWPDSFVEEANLTQTIYLLRKVLGEGLNDDHYVETIPKRGYRFVASVREFGSEGTDITAKEQVDATVRREEGVSGQGEAETKISANERKGLRLGVLTACVMLVGLTVAGYYLQVKQTGSPAPTDPPAPIKSIAVLPFKPLVAESRDESLEFGMTDTLITRLGNLRQVMVRPLSAVRRYTGLEQDAAATGGELKVESVLDGSIQRVADRIRVRVRLVRVEDGRTLWAETFDEKLSDIFAVQDSISQRVAGALAAKLTGEEKVLLAKHHTKNTEAYQLYAKGRYFWNRGTEEGLRKAIKHFQQALEKDPNYALAYTGLADSYALLGVYGLIPMRESHPKAKEAATRALELDEKLGEAHASLAAILIDYYWDWAEAKRQLQRALVLNPNYVTAHSIYANYLKAVGRLGEAIEEAKRAQELDPVSPSSNLTLATAYYDARQYDQAIKQSQEILELDPNFVPARVNLGFAYVQKKMYEEAISEFQKVRALLGGSSDMVALLGYAYAMAGKKDEARKALDELNRLSKQRHVSPFGRAQIYAGLGENDLVFEWLEKAYEDRFWLMGLLKVDPTFDSLRSDPRFTDLVRRIGLTP
jgi:DNA-binding winged helix-turn-helix (wHTH) protein/TolB-like protein/Tfp pilus assembly protein PilF